MMYVHSGSCWVVSAVLHIPQLSRARVQVGPQLHTQRPARVAQASLRAGRLASGRDEARPWCRGGSARDGLDLRSVPAQALERSWLLGPVSLQQLGGGVAVPLPEVLDAVER